MAKRPLHEYLGQAVIVTTGAVTQFTGKIIGFGSSAAEGHDTPRQLLHIEDEHGETGWFEVGEVSVGGNPLAIKKPVSEALNDLERYCEREMLEADKKRRISTTSNQIRSALGGRRTALSEIIEQVRVLRTAYIEE